MYVLLPMFVVKMQFVMYQNMREMWQNANAQEIQNPIEIGEAILIKNVFNVLANKITIN